MDQSTMFRQNKTVDDFEVIGQFNENQILNGIAKCTWKDKTEFLGQFVDGLRNGFGRYTFPDSTSYICFNRQNKFCGFGIVLNQEDQLQKFGIFFNNILILNLSNKLDQKQIMDLKKQFQEIILNQEQLYQNTSPPKGKCNIANKIKTIEKQAALVCNQTKELDNQLQTQYKQEYARYLLIIKLNDLRIHNISLPSGESYLGQLQNELHHGLCKYVYLSGDYYIGFTDGFGTLYSQSDGKRIGFWNNNNVHGQYLKINNKQILICDDMQKDIKQPQSSILKKLAHEFSQLQQLIEQTFIQLPSKICNLKLEMKKINNELLSNAIDQLESEITQLQQQAQQLQQQLKILTNQPANTSATTKLNSQQSHSTSIINNSHCVIEQDLLLSEVDIDDFTCQINDDYCGQLSQQSKHGVGEILYTKIPWRGERFLGCFVQNKKNGFGCHFHRDGQKSVGFYLNDQYAGYCAKLAAGNIMMSFGLFEKGLLIKNLFNQLNEKQKQQLQNIYLEKIQIAEQYLTEISGLDQIKAKQPINMAKRQSEVVQSISDSVQITLITKQLNSPTKQRIENEIFTKPEPVDTYGHTDSNLLNSSNRDPFAEITQLHELINAIKQQREQQEKLHHLQLQSLEMQLQINQSNNDKQQQIINHLQEQHKYFMEQLQIANSHEFQRKQQEICNQMMYERSGKSQSGQYNVKKE